MNINFDELKNFYREKKYQAQFNKQWIEYDIYRDTLEAIERLEAIQKGLIDQGILGIGSPRT